MSNTSKIEWTDATWNPVRGCSVISPGCVNCYAMKQAHRFSGPGGAYEGLTKQTSAGPQWAGVVRTVEDALDQPRRWRKPQRVFVNSMSDLFHEALPDEAIDRVFAVMALCPQHTFQVLTKRPERMLDWAKLPRPREYQSDWWGWWRERSLKVGGPQASTQWPLPNVWLGVSVEDQATADARIPLLLQTPAAVRFVSYEPALGPVDFAAFLGCGDLHCAHPDHRNMCRATHPPCAGLDWVIAGGESGEQGDIAGGVRGLAVANRRHGHFRPVEPFRPLPHRYLSNNDSLKYIKFSANAQPPRSLTPLKGTYDHQ
jgi:protein gp37